MKRIFPAIRKMTWEETRCHQLQNPGLVLEYNNLMIPLNAGYSDHVMIYLHGTTLLILTTNRRLGYVGLDEVECQDGDSIGTLFMEEYQLESLCRQWFHMKPETLIKRLLPYL